MKIIALFNTRGGMGNTTLVYHIAWMMAELGRRVLVADLDPQATLSSMLLNDERLKMLWPDTGNHQSVLACIDPILRGTGDIAPAYTEKIVENLYLLPGDPGLSQFEDKLSDSWSRYPDHASAAFRTISAFYRILRHAAEDVDAEIVLIDVGPNLGAVSRSALIAAEYVISPLIPDLFFLQGMKNMRYALRQWRHGWKQRMNQKPDELDIPLSSASMKPMGYIIMQLMGQRRIPIEIYLKMSERIPAAYQQYVLDRKTVPKSGEDDPNHIGMVRHYCSLMPMAREAGKPIFLLRPSEGAIGAHAQAVSKYYMNFKRITETIMKRET